MNPETVVKSEETRKCPFCCEEIEADAKKCKNCGECLDKKLQKSRVTSILLILFLGNFGIHKFYLRQNIKGILYLLFCWTSIPGLLAFIDLVKFIIWNDEKFDEYVIANS